MSEFAHLLDKQRKAKKPGAVGETPKSGMSISIPDDKPVMAHIPEQQAEEEEGSTYRENKQKNEKLLPARETEQNTFSKEMHEGDPALEYKKNQEYYNELEIKMHKQIYFKQHLKKLRELRATPLRREEPPK